MARVTVEDCIDKVSNRFQLVMLAAHRARSLSSGAPLTVDRDNDKNPVVALREIAEETIDLAELEDLLIKSLQKHVETDELDEEDPDILSSADAYTGELMPPIEQPAPEEDDTSVWRRAAPADDEEYGDEGDEESGDGKAPDFSGQDVDEAEE